VLEGASRPFTPGYPSHGIQYSVLNRANQKSWMLRGLYQLALDEDGSAFHDTEAILLASWQLTLVPWQWGIEGESIYWYAMFVGSPFSQLFVEPIRRKAP
jgi:hypothetical protein